MFVPVAAEIIGELVKGKKLPESATVVELGNQTYSVSQEVINKLLPDFPKLKALAGRKPARKPKDPEAPHVSEFFSALGFVSYQSIDINTDLGSMAMDLNYDIQEKYGFKEKFDLSTNIGVSEHLFAQEAFMRNMHNVTKKGGIMLHVLPFLGYINHGFYNYEPRIFYDLAASNGYRILELKLAERDRMVIDLKKETSLLTYFYPYLPFLIRNEERSAFVVAVLMKKEDRPFVMPLQGKYLEDIGESGILGAYGDQSDIESYPPPKGFFEKGKGFGFKEKLKAALLRRLWKIGRLILNY